MLEHLQLQIFTCSFIWELIMENNILELGCSEQPISAYQAIGLIDCNISAQGIGPFRYQKGFRIERSIHSDLSFTVPLISAFWKSVKNTWPHQAIIFTRKRTVKKTKSSTSGSSDNSGRLQSIAWKNKKGFQEMRRILKSPIGSFQEWILSNESLQRNEQSSELNILNRGMYCV